MQPKRESPLLTTRSQSRIVEAIPVDGFALDERPDVSVIIPARNCADLLRRSLNHLSDSTCEAWEVIVVDDASTDDTAHIAEQSGPRVVRLSYQSGPAAARNAGASIAQADILLFLDADVCVHPDTLEQVVAAFAAHPQAAAVFGSYDTQPTALNLISQYKNLAHHFVHQTAHKQATTFWAGCGAVRRSAFLDTGGFDETYTRPCIEDIELGGRLHQRGHRVLLEKNVQATHLKEWTLGSLLRADVFDRGVPWTRLILRNRQLPNDLNLKASQRVCTVCVFVLAAMFLWTVWQLPLILVPAVMSLLALHAVDRWSRSHRAALPTGLTGAGVVLGGIASLSAGAWCFPFVAAALVLAVIALNAPLYRFFADQRGLAFTLYVVPLHCLYYLYSGLALGIGVGLHVSSKIDPWTTSARLFAPSEAVEEHAHAR